MSVSKATQFATEVVNDDPSATATVFFLHGWPDTTEVFDPLVAELKEQRHLRLVRMSLPGFGKKDNAGTIPWAGYELAELVVLYRATVAQFQRGKDHPLYLICHDWGAFVSYEFIFQNPDVFTKVVAMDIGSHSEPPATLYGTALTLWYQWTLATSFFLPRFVATPVSQTIAWLFGAPSAWQARSSMSYMYYKLWKMLLWTKKKPAFMKKFWIPPMDFVFMYGEGKPMSFHSKRFAKAVAEAGDGRLVGYEGSGVRNHWFFVDKRHQKDVARRITDFFAATTKSRL